MSEAARLADLLVELLLGEPRYRSDEIAEKADLHLDSARRIWRAMGFAEPPEDEPFFTEADLDALRRAVALVEAGHADEQLIVTMARVLSQSVAQAARAQTEAITARISSPEGEIDPNDAPQVIGQLESLMVHIWKRHLAAALQHDATLQDQSKETEESTVGFADLVGFTRLSHKLDETELTELVERFDSDTQEVVAEVGGRIVKTIGDEVMFVAREAATAGEAALRILEAFPEDEESATVRIGLATGPVVRYRGDVFGPTVNLASRAVGEARPASILVADETREHLSENDGFSLKPLRNRRLKGVGNVRLWRLRRADPD